MPAENFQSSLCISLHQKYCIEHVCRNPEGQMLIKTSEILLVTMQNTRINGISIFFFFLLFLSSSKFNLKILNVSGFI